MAAVKAAPPPKAAGMAAAGEAALPSRHRRTWQAWCSLSCVWLSGSPDVILVLFELFVQHFWLLLKLLQYAVCEDGGVAARVPPYIAEQVTCGNGGNASAFFTASQAFLVYRHHWTLLPLLHSLSTDFWCGARIAVLALLAARPAAFLRLRGAVSTFLHLGQVVVHLIMATTLPPATFPRNDMRAFYSGPIPTMLIWTAYRMCVTGRLPFCWHLPLGLLEFGLIWSVRLVAERRAAGQAISIGGGTNAAAVAASFALQCLLPLGVAWCCKRHDRGGQQRGAAPAATGAAFRATPAAAADRRTRVRKAGGVVAAAVRSPCTSDELSGGASTSGGGASTSGGGASTIGGSHHGSSLTTASIVSLPLTPLAKNSRNDADDASSNSSRLASAVAAGHTVSEADNASSAQASCASWLTNKPPAEPEASLPSSVTFYTPRLVTPVAADDSAGRDELRRAHGSVAAARALAGTAAPSTSALYGSGTARKSVISVKIRSHPGLSFEEAAAQVKAQVARTMENADVSAALSAGRCRLVSWKAACMPGCVELVLELLTLPEEENRNRRVVADSVSSAASSPDRQQHGRTPTTISRDGLDTWLAAAAANGQHHGENNGDCQDFVGLINRLVAEQLQAAEEASSSRRMGISRRTSLSMSRTGKVVEQVVAPASPPEPLPRATQRELRAYVAPVACLAPYMQDVSGRTLSLQLFVHPGDLAAAGLDMLRVAAVLPDGRTVLDQHFSVATDLLSGQPLTLTLPAAALADVAAAVPVDTLTLFLMDGNATNVEGAVLGDAPVLLLATAQAAEEVMQLFEEMVSQETEAALMTLDLAPAGSRSDRSGYAEMAYAAYSAHFTHFALDMAALASNAKAVTTLTVDAGASHATAVAAGGANEAAALRQRLLNFMELNSMWGCVQLMTQPAAALQAAVGCRLRSMAQQYAYHEAGEIEAEQLAPMVEGTGSSFRRRHRDSAESIISGSGSGGACQPAAACRAGAPSQHAPATAALRSSTDLGSEIQAMDLGQGRDNSAAGGRLLQPSPAAVPSSQLSRDSLAAAAASAISSVSLLLLLLARCISQPFEALATRAFTRTRLFGTAIKPRDLLLGFAEPGLEARYVESKNRSLRTVDNANLWVLTLIRVAVVLRTAMASGMMHRTKLIGAAIISSSLAGGGMVLAVLHLPRLAPWHQRHRDSLMLVHTVVCAASLLLSAGGGWIPEDVRIVTSISFTPYLVLVVIAALIRQLRMRQEVLLATAIATGVWFSMRAQGAEKSLLWAAAALVWVMWMVVAAATELGMRHVFLTNRARQDARQALQSTSGARPNQPLLQDISLQRSAMAAAAATMAAVTQAATIIRKLLAAAGAFCAAVTSAAVRRLLHLARRSAYASYTAVNHAFTRVCLFGTAVTLCDLILGFSEPGLEASYMEIKNRSLMGFDPIKYGVVTVMRIVILVRTVCAHQLSWRTKLLSLAIGLCSLLSGGVMMLFPLQQPALFNFCVRWREPFALAQALICIFTVVITCGGGFVPTDVRWMTASRYLPFVALVTVTPAVIHQLRLGPAAIFSLACALGCLAAMRMQGGAPSWRVAATIWLGSITTAAATEWSTRHWFLTHRAKLLAAAARDRAGRCTDGSDSNKSSPEQKQKQQAAKGACKDEGASGSGASIASEIQAA